MELSKSDQLKKHKEPNHKKMSKQELKEFQMFINDKSRGICQLCGQSPIMEYHHSLFGCRGADKDDRSICGVCRDCHDKCHADKHGFNLKAVEIGERNYKGWQDEISK